MAVEPDPESQEPAGPYPTGITPVTIPPAGSEITTEEETVGEDQTLNADQRLEIYQGLVEALLNGQELSPEGINVLVYGIMSDPEVDIPGLDMYQLTAQLEDQEKGGVTTQKAELEKAWRESELMGVDPTAQGIQDLIVTAGIGIGSAVVSSGIRGARIAGSVGASRLGGAAASTIPFTNLKYGTTLPQVLRSLLSVRNVVKGGLLGLGGLTGYGMLTQNQTAAREAGPVGATGTTTTTTPGAGGLPSRSPGRGGRAGQPGQPLSGSATTSPQDEIIAEILRITQQGASGGALSPDMVALARELNIDPSRLQGGTYQKYEPANPLAMGLYEFDPTNYPYGATSTGTPAAQGLTQEQIAAFKRASGSQIPVAPERWTLNAEQTQTLNQGVIAPGGQIAARAFQEVRGKTILQHVMETAKRYNVPAALLYGIIARESEFKTSAVGDNGNSFGLVQIYLPAHPDITKAQALDPLFAINWAARNLSQNYRRYKRWDAAVMAHNSPNAANQFTQTGTVADSDLRRKTFNYVQFVFGQASASGIGDELFDLDAIDAGASGPEEGAGPDMTASQINNIKAQIRGLWEHWMGPGAADEAYLNQWASDLFYGRKGDDELNQSIKSMSTGRWPNKPVDLTWTEWSLPYRTQIQSMLEIPKLDNTDPILGKALDQQLEGRDLDKLIKQDTRWLRTANYRDSYSQAAIELGRAFGYVT